VQGGVATIFDTQPNGLDAFIGKRNAKVLLTLVVGKDHYTHGDGTLTL
jgi:hypothetical protein